MTAPESGRCFGLGASKRSPGGGPHAKRSLACHLQLPSGHPIAHELNVLVFRDFGWAGGTNRGSRLDRTIVSCIFGGMCSSIPLLQRLCS